MGFLMRRGKITEHEGTVTKLARVRVRLYPPVPLEPDALEARTVVYLYRSDGTYSREMVSDMADLMNMLRSAELIGREA